MDASKRNNSRCKLRIGDMKLERIQKFKSLRSVVKDRNGQKNVTAKSERAFQKLSIVLRKGKCCIALSFWWKRSQ